MKKKVWKPGGPGIWEIRNRESGRLLRIKQIKQRQGRGEDDHQGAEEGKDKAPDLSEACNNQQ